MLTMEESMSNCEGNRKRKRGGEKKGGRPGVSLKSDFFTYISGEDYQCRIKGCQDPHITNARGTLTFYIHFRDMYPNQCKWVTKQPKYAPTNKEVESFYRTQDKNSIIAMQPVLVDEEGDEFVGRSGYQVEETTRVLRRSPESIISLSSSTAGSSLNDTDDDTISPRYTSPRLETGYFKLASNPADKAKWAELKKLISSDSVPKKGRSKKANVEWFKGDMMQYRIITNEAILNHPALVKKKITIKEKTFSEEERMAGKYGEGHIYAIM
jgi:hypothetical protein